MIEWIVTSSAMILLVLLLRVLVKGRVSPRLRYALWGLVLLRLVIPVSLWESPVSVLRAAQASEGYQLASTLPTHMELYENGTFQSVSGKYDTFRMEPGIFQGEPSPPLRNAYGWVAVPSAEEAQALREQGQKAVNTTELKHLVDLQNLLRTVWQAGVWLSLLFLAVVNGRFALSLRRKRRPDGDYRGRPVFLADGLPSPCLFGLFRPAIYLTPEVAADDTARVHVLAHEYAHFRQGDHAWAIWRGVCLALHWYNPLVWLAAYLSRRDCELSCDEGAVRLLGEENRADYGRTLVGLVARRTTPKDLACCATTMTGGKSALKERIALLVKHPRTTAVMAVLVAAACAVFAVCTFTGAAKAEEPAETVEPVQTEEEPRETDLPEGFPSLEDLPTEVINAYTLGDLYENTDPYWLLDQVEGEDIALYGVNPLGAADEVRGIYLRYGEHLQYFDQVAMPYQFIRPHLTWYDFDGDGENELLTVYAVLKGTTVDQNELVVYEWEGDRWSEHRYDPTGLIEDFNANVEFESDGDMSRISYQGRSTQVALGGEECFLNDYVTGYTLYGKDGWGILLSLWGEVGPALTSHNYAFDYMCNIYYNPDGTFTEGSGIFESFYDPEPDLPALEDLPTTLFDIPDAYQDPIWLIAELPEEDIAVYFEEETGRSWLRYGSSLQKLEIVGGLPMTPRKLPPELYFQDLDSDGEKELAMIHNSDSGTGVSVWSLTVFEWDEEGKVWAAYPARLEENIIRDFETGHTLTRHLEEKYVTVGFQGSTVDVDMKDMFGSYTAWKDEPLYAEITGMFSAYSMESYGLSLTLAGELRPASYDPTTSYGFEYTCNVYYEADGTFRSTWGYLDTEYPWMPTADDGLLTPVFRDILRGFIDECRAEGMEDLSTERFAICDVNGDGKDELITQRNNTYMAGQVERVYDADGNELLAEYPVPTYYDNGYVTAGWSHNQGVSGDKLWPYTLYRYDGSAGKYVPEASVDGWDKSIRDTYPAFGDNDGDYYIDQSVIPFPDDIDKDGDGFVYYIITEEGGYAPVYGEPMDYADYALWAARYLGANRWDVTYYPLTEKNIALIEQD